MKPRIFIDGDQGTTGLRIHALLAGRADLAVVTLPAERRKDPGARAAAINDCDIALLCLPDDAARQAMAAVTDPQVRVIDASSAHRVDTDWVYGFAEMRAGQASRIASARRVSNPGCYPTGAVALLRPLIDASLLTRDYPVVVSAVSGYSGRGRAGIDAFEKSGQGGASGPPAFQVYGLSLDHKHVPEIAWHAGLSAPPLFVPAYGAFRQGIVLTIPIHLRLLPHAVSAALMQACLEDRYAGVPHVQVMPLSDARALPHLDPQALNGSNALRLALFANEARGQVLLSAVFDNLGKGAAGAAVQNLDLMLGSSRLSDLA